MNSISARPAGASENTLLIFPALPDFGCGGGSCSCHADASKLTPALTLEEFTSKLKASKEWLANNVQTVIAGYESLPAVIETMKQLNVVFAASGINFTVTEANLGTILTAYAPILALNGRIVATGAFPDAAQLLNHLPDGEVQHA